MYRQILFRMCHYSDFYDKGYDENDIKINQEAYEQRLCPNLEELNEYLIIKNLYTSPERVSFGVEVIKCDNTTYNCKNDTQIDNLLNSIYFTLYYSEEILDYNELNDLSRSDPKQKATSIVDKFST